MLELYLTHSFVGGVRQRRCAILRSKISWSSWILKISTFRKCVKRVRNDFVDAAQAKILRSGWRNHRILGFKVEIQYCYQGKKVDNRWKCTRQIFRYCLVWGRLGSRMFGFLTDHGSWDNGTSWILNNMIFLNALEFCSISEDQVKNAYLIKKRAYPYMTSPAQGGRGQEIFQKKVTEGEGLGEKVTSP